MIDEAKEFFQMIKERLGGHLGYMYVFFFVVINWDHLLLLIFGQGDFDQKIPIFKAEIADIRYWYYVLPAIFAVASILLFPFINATITLYNQQVQRLQKNRSMEIMGKTSIDSKEQLAMMKAHSESSKDYEEEIARLKKLLASLDSSNSALNGEVVTLKNIIAEKDNALQSEKDALKNYSEKYDYKVIDELISAKVPDLIDLQFLENQDKNNSNAFKIFIQKFGVYVCSGFVENANMKSKFIESKLVVPYRDTVLVTNHGAAVLSYFRDGIIPKYIAPLRPQIKR